MSDSKIEIIPSLLTNNPNELRQLISQCEGEVNRIHIDIIDGVYADNKTIDPFMLSSVETSLIIDFHLMVDNPTKWIEKCLRGNAERLIAQIEMMTDQLEFVEKTSILGMKPGLALDINSQVSEINENVLPSLDVILVMSVPAGFGGQKFHAEALGKIQELDQMRKEKGYRYSICDDGGITIDLIDDIRAEGADEAVVGRRLFKGDISDNVEKFEEAS